MMLGVVLVTLCIALIALVSGWRVRSTGEFTVAGRRAGWTVVSGIIVGALVGGASPVGTSPAAVVFGLPALGVSPGPGVRLGGVATLFAPPMPRLKVGTPPP